MFKDSVTFIDLFAGIGGFRIALEHFGGKCIFSSEIDKYACMTYRANFGDMPHGDITKIDAKDIPSHDILCGGFPCQPFSISGLQRGFEDSRGTLFFEIARIAAYHKPKVLFLENVANLEKHSDGATISRMISILEEIGYNVFYSTLNASEYGVPQSRKRVYIIGFRKDLEVTKFEFPKPSYKDVALEDILLPDEETKDYLIIRDDIVMKDIVVEKRQLKPIRIGTINKGGQGDRIYSPKGHAITLSAEGGGAGAKTGAYLVNGKVRKLAPKECRAVQGFPEKFIIPVSDSQAWKQFGNSVAVPVLKEIVNKITQVEQIYKKS
ncbi:DNA (cytosine-5-)-methyltransferase [Caproiciproducens sp. MSJ-32]|uniref:DNA (cytosine-5-)-methyltransferase n=1 Tax=Caproiciproducens sp. MSJ-32 TaxID=2841527 RepID=UPI001C11228E|nr:DNA (cytosine-5-)-methyltransferase [Caproiciproducens sp. MSJ-32]